ncbi:3-hydroxyacyl-ACP dehydratase FabZ [bacterium]|nr:3-hydroxyacyl-ACP dehydratase FabZ [bacterium]
MDIQQIMSYLPHRYPFLLVDKILEIRPGKSIVGSKNVTYNEPFFGGHFPTNPVMPGVLIIEAMAQVGGIFALDALGLKAGATDTETQIFFMTIDKARFRKPVRPGDILIMTIRLINQRRNFWKFSGRAEVDGVLVSEANMMASIGDGK